MRYYFHLIGVLLIFSQVCEAQTGDASGEDSLFQYRQAKAIYVEALGTSGFGFSINYDMRFKPGHEGWGFRVGASQVIREGRFTSYPFPVLLNRVSTNKRLAFEQGVGALVIYRRWYYDGPNNSVDQYRRFYYKTAVQVGIRVQPVKTGVLWRLYWSPTWTLGQPLSTANLFWFGTSLGIGFN